MSVIDIAAVSTYMSQSSLQSSVSTSVLKIAMDSGKEMASEMTNMMGKMAVDTSRGMNLDVRA